MPPRRPPGCKRGRHSRCEYEYSRRGGLDGCPRREPIRRSLRRTARRRNMSAPDASGEADRLASAQGARSAQAAQIANIAARLERLPLTSYQKVIFAIISTAWFFDSMDLGALTFLLGSIKQTFQLSSAEVGLLSSLSFL